MSTDDVDNEDAEQIWHANTRKYKHNYENH
jgi:hypothetical protein